MVQYLHFRILKFPLRWAPFLFKWTMKIDEFLWYSVGFNEQNLISWMGAQGECIMRGCKRRVYLTRLKSDRSLSQIHVNSVKRFIYILYVYIYIWPSLLDINELFMFSPNKLFYIRIYINTYEYEYTYIYIWINMTDFIGYKRTFHIFSKQNGGFGLNLNKRAVLTYPVFTASSWTGSSDFKRMSWQWLSFTHTETNIGYTIYIYIYTVHIYIYTYYVIHRSDPKSSML
jgi:hypothetical protein